MKNILLFVILLFFSCKEFNYSDIRRRSSKGLNASSGASNKELKISFVDSLNDDQKEALFLLSRWFLIAIPTSLIKFLI